jgi:hypothetical protein
VAFVWFVVNFLKIDFRELIFSPGGGVAGAHPLVKGKAGFQACGNELLREDYRVPDRKATSQTCGDCRRSGTTGPVRPGGFNQAFFKNFEIFAIVKKVNRFRLGGLQSFF